MEIEIVRVHRNAFVFELDNNFDAVAFGARGEVEKRMFVEAKLGLNTLQASATGVGHIMDSSEKRKILTTEDAGTTEDQK
jgi:hypothetical protein